MASSIDGQYKVIACQLKTHWLAPGVWSYYIWEIKNGRFKLHNHDVCPSAYVGSFVKHATGDVVADDAMGTLDMTPDGGQFAGQTLRVSSSLTTQEKLSVWCWPFLDTNVHQATPLILARCTKLGNVLKRRRAPCLCDAQPGRTNNQL